MSASALWMNIGPTSTSLGTATIATDGTITLTAHGLADGDAVAFDTLTGGADGVIAENEAYYVRNKTDDTFQVSGSRGGVIVTFTSAGGAAVYSANPGYPAETLRQINSHLMFHGSTNRLGARQGVRPGAGDPISVSGTTWKVETHTGTVEPAETSTQGPYDYVCLEETGTLTAADASNGRLDALDLLIEDDDADATGFRRARVVYTAGTASGTPTAPTALNNALRLGTILVPASGGDDPSVDDLALWTVASGGVLPVRDDDELPTTGLYTGMTAYNLDTEALIVYDGMDWVPIASSDTYASIRRLGTTKRTTNSSSFSSETVINTVEVDVVSGATYRVRWAGDVASSVAADVARVRIREDDASGTLIQLGHVYLPTTARDYSFTVEGEFTAATTGTQTFAATCERVVGTGSLACNANANEPQYLYVDYIRG